MISHKASETVVKVAACTVVKDAPPKDRNRGVTFWRRKSTSDRITFETSLELRPKVKKTLIETNEMYAKIMKKEKVRIPVEFESFARHLHLTPHSLYDNVAQDLKKELDDELCQEFLR